MVNVKQIYAFYIKFAKPPEISVYGEEFIAAYRIYMVGGVEANTIYTFIHALFFFILMMNRILNLGRYTASV